MSNILWFLFEQTLSIFQSCVFIYFAFSVLEFNKKLSKPLAFAIGVLAEYLMVLLLNKFGFFEYGQILFYSAVLFIFNLLFTQGSILKKALISLIPTNCVLGTSMLASNLISYIFQKPISDLMTESSVYRILFVVIGNTLFFFTVWLIKLFLKKNMKTLNHQEWTILITLFAISIITIVLIYSSIIYGVERQVLTYLYLVIICIAVINISTYFLLVQLSKKHNLAVEHKLLKQHYQHQAESINKMKKQYETLQKARHDFNNTLTVIQSLCEGKDFDSIKQYISQYLSVQSQNVCFVSTNNEYVNAIVNSMVSKANHENIIVKTNISKIIDWENSIDLCNLIGNLFENAITASKQCDDRKEIFFELNKIANGIGIFIKNSIPKSVLKSNKELKTSKRNKNKHGYGIKIIKEITTKYSGLFDFYEDDNMFCCNVEIYEKQ